LDPANLLLSTTQDGRLIEDNVDEFLELSNMVPWNMGTLKTVLKQVGLSSCPTGSSGFNNHLFPAAVPQGCPEAK